MVILVIFYAGERCKHFCCKAFRQCDLDCCSSVSRSSPRKVDLIIAMGTMAMKMASVLIRLYE